MADSIAIGCEIRNENRRTISSPIVKEREQALKKNAYSLVVPLMWHPDSSISILTCFLRRIETKRTTLRRVLLLVLWSKRPQRSNERNNYTIYLASGNDAAKDGWLGLGASLASSQFTVSSVVIPANATITGIALNIRDNHLADNTESITATVYKSECGFVNPETTGIYAKITGPNSQSDPHCFALRTGSAPVLAGTLLSVKITANNALSNGTAVSSIMTIP